MEIIIHPIHKGLNTVYALRGENVILIDGGNLNCLSSLKTGFAEVGIQPQEIKLIVLTHGHFDHIGSTKDLKELTGAEVIMHQKDLHLLDDNLIHLQGFNVWSKLGLTLMKPFAPLLKFPPFEVDIIAHDDEHPLLEYGIPGKLINTPGHTWGSVSLLLDSGEAFVGDLAMNRLPLLLAPVLPITGDDLQTVKESWRKLLAAGAKIVYPAHGKAFPAEAIRKAVTD